MANLLAVTGARIFDSETWHDAAALLLRDGRIEGIVPLRDIPSSADRLALSGGSVIPGFVDLQVNGGGGVLFNNQPDVDAIRAICVAHARFGTTALLPTLITDNVAVTEAAIAAGIEAGKRKVPGFLGLHLEGPHLAVARKGTHDPGLIRPITPQDLDRLIAACGRLPSLLLTVAAETVGADQIRQLVDAGIIVSIGHSDADFVTAEAAFDAGASQATHLFNAMSQLQNREPGLVGAVLDNPGIYAGLIADGIHVHPGAIRVALAAKRPPGRIFLVTDAMSQTGSDLKCFMLNGRQVYRAHGALRLKDGTLAGADLDMIDAVNFMHRIVGVSWEEAVRMASLYPAQAMGLQRDYGVLRSGSRADFIHLDGANKVMATWVAGLQVYQN